MPRVLKAVQEQKVKAHRLPVEETLGSVHPSFHKTHSLFVLKNSISQLEFANPSWLLLIRARHSIAHCAQLIALKLAPHNSTKHYEATPHVSTSVPDPTGTTSPVN